MTGRRGLPSPRDGDYTRSAYREDMISLFALLRRRGLSLVEIARARRSAPVPMVDGPALQLADDIVRLQERVR
jgi:hypothetical protein